MEKKANKARMWIGGGILLLATAVGIGAWMARDRAEPLPPVTAPAVDLAKFAASERFASLPAVQQEPYVQALMQKKWEILEAVRTGKMQREEAQKVFENSFSAGSLIYARQYRQVQGKAAQQAFLDKIIDETESLMGANLAQMFRWGPAANSPTQGPSRWMNLDRAKQRVESMPPLERAILARFLGDMRDRRQERGLPVEPR